MRVYACIRLYVCQSNFIRWNVWGNNKSIIKLQQQTNILLKPYTLTHTIIIISPSLSSPPYFSKNQTLFFFLTNEFSVFFGNKISANIIHRNNKWIFNILLEVKKRKYKTGREDWGWDLLVFSLVVVVIVVIIVVSGVQSS